MAVGVPTQEDREREEEAIRKEQVHACEEHTAELQKTSYLYQQVFAQTRLAMKRISDGHVTGTTTSKHVVQSLIHSLDKHEMSMAMIDILASSKTDDSFIAHALNVCVVSLLVGKEYHLDDDELYALGLAGLLHDLGKQNFSPMFRTKRSGLTKGEQQEWLGHPDVGKGAAERFPSAIPAATVQAIYQHHERLDGSGFPLGLQGDEISLFARVVMVADEYDHLCHHEDQDKSLTSAEALPYLYDKYIVNKLVDVGDMIQQMFNKNDDASNGTGTPADDDWSGLDSLQTKATLSEEVIVSMVRALGVYPPGSLVELTNGLMGLVTGVNSDERTKPCVMI